MDTLLYTVKNFVRKSDKILQQDKQTPAKWHVGLVFHQAKLRLMMEDKATGMAFVITFQIYAAASQIKALEWNLS